MVIWGEKLTTHRQSSHRGVGTLLGTAANGIFAVVEWDEAAVTFDMSVDCDEVLKDVGSEKAILL
jgi:hypothetical protein